ncbi:general secretion pathway protein GspK [Pseudoalteromonas pernae]|uniref:general secretion pathway protein GspK n=1 Tax=Pseudoalteromonas pernae TaxID=3118054 RepID=UPI0032424EA7
MKQAKSMGIALVQVLIITTILSLLGLYVTSTSQRHVGLAQNVKDSFEAKVLLAQAEAELIHALTTQLRDESVVTDHEVTKKWNFHGKPFSIDEYTSVVMQDYNGLINLNSFDRQLVSIMLANEGLQGSDIQKVVDSLLDWVDVDDAHRLNGAERQSYSSVGKIGPRNGYFQSLDEVFSVKGTQLVRPSFWYDNFTALPDISSLTLTHSTEDILAALIRDDAALGTVLQLREQRSLNMRNFIAETGVEDDESQNFIPGNRLRIKLVTKYGKESISTRFDVWLNLRSLNKPVYISNRVWNK